MSKPFYILLCEKLPADQWLTCKQAYDVVGRTLLRWPWEVHPRMNYLVKKGLVERIVDGEVIKWRKIPAEQQLAA